MKYNKCSDLHTINANNSIKTLEMEVNMSYFMTY